ncbi:hypothetical protein C7H79_05535 [Nitrosomonas supralitoralis]|uniref:Uncharacterized protein n=2 Tax=Nitrosomonas supralitoralis TaxID=2116706 RepID=A0A2P7NWZ0_9PROT|nr:hypothetical protein C7H79_05535 [Nitrosomonas supralitoralis]
MVLNANAFLRDSLFGSGTINLHVFCHRPIIVIDLNTLLGKIISRLQVNPKSEVDDVVVNDLILLWSNERKVITGADILGRLLRGITIRNIKPPQKNTTL